MMKHRKMWKLCPRDAMGSFHERYPTMAAKSAEPLNIYQ